MTAKRGLVLLLLVVLAGPAVPSFAGVRFGGVAAGFGYTDFNGPFYGPFGYAPGWWGPYYGPFWAPYYPAYYANPGRGPNMGQVRIKTAFSHADLYINGAYAGPAGKLKSMWLQPGAYDLELRPENHSTIEQRIYVLTGKTLDVRMGEAKR
jgi:hypothetical protein